jgi:hypothetical protein
MGIRRWIVISWDLGIALLGGSGVLMIWIYIFLFRGRNSYLIASNCNDVSILL